MNQPTYQEFIDWRCPDCGGPASGYRMDAETAKEGRRNIDKRVAALGMIPEQTHEFVVSRHYTFTCDNGHEHYIGEYFTGA